MKPFFSLIACLVLFLVLSCQRTENVSDVSSAVVADSSEPASSVPTAICIWKEVSIRETPSEKGKYITTVYLGEKFEALPDTASEKSKDRIVKFNRIKLGDGTEGWVRAEFIAVNAVPAAFLNDATIYKRPDLMTSSKKNFYAMDFVAVQSKNQNGWAEVKGKRSGDTWFTTGWVKSENLTLDMKDVTLSVLYLKAMSIEDESNRMEEIRTLLMNSDLMASVFYSRVSGIYNTRGMEAEDYSEEDTSAVD